MELECDVMKKALYRVHDNIVETTERVTKIEAENYRRMATITGLYTDREDKAIARRQIDAFIADNLGINLKIESAYEMGSAIPPIKVVTFHSIREKEKVFKYKSYLKGIKNADGQAVLHK